jgi:RNA polymerase sigma-70 factor, ECF subfamily
VTAVPPDDELVRLARRGDALAFRTLVDRYQPRVASVAISMLSRGADAEDVGQETFIRFYNSLNEFRGDSALGTYLCRIAMNLSLNTLKQRKRAQLRLVSRDESPTDLAEPPVEAYDAVTVERRDRVRWAVTQLSETHRPVVVLRLLEERSTNETADALQLPPGTVMSRLSRGLVELKRLLAPYITGSEDE